MNTEFQSIFSSNENVDANLSKIFKRKVDNKVNKNELEDILSNSSEDDEEIAAANSKGAKQSLVKKRNAESENRTIFIGNLNCDCKKEVHETFKISTPIFFALLEKKHKYLSN